MRSRAAVAVVAAWVAAGVATGRGGFTPGDLYLATVSLPGNTRGVLRIDPATWQSSQLITFQPTEVGAFAGRFAYDPMRDRLVMPDTPTALTLIDSTGARAPLTHNWAPQVTLVAPTRDGRIYLSAATVTVSGPRLAYINASGSTFEVMNAAGTSHYVLALHFDGMIYHPGTNSLIVAIPDSSPNVRFRKLALSANGSRVIDDTQQSTFNVSAAGPRVVGLSRGPGDTIFAKVDDNSNGTLPRMLLVNPATLAVSTYASSGYFGVGGEIAGCYSPAHDAAVILDSLNDLIRTFTFGSSGAGVTRPTTGVSGGGSGENAQIIAITPRACAGDANGDGLVDFVDLNIVLSNFGATGPAVPGDINHDGEVNFIDLNIVLSFFGVAC